MTLDQALTAGTRITGAVVVDELPNYSQVIAFNAITGDIVGTDYVGDDYALPVLHGQWVKLRCSCSHGPIVWHGDGSTGFNDAKPAWVGHQPITVDFDMG